MIFKLLRAYRIRYLRRMIEDSISGVEDLKSKHKTRKDMPEYAIKQLGLYLQMYNYAVERLWTLKVKQ